MYNLEQLRMFVETAQLGSFSACARHLGKVQSAVSQGIANLEIDLNTTLFDRTTRKPSLTANGKRLLPFAQGILQQTYEFDYVNKALNLSHETEIKMAVDDGLLPVMSGLLKNFATRFPGTVLKLYAVAAPDVLMLVNSGRADLGLIFTSNDYTQEVDLCYIGSLPFNGVVSPTHPLANIDIVTDADLLPHRQLMILGLDGKTLSYCPHISTDIWFGSTFDVINTMVQEGLGWSYIPAYMAEQFEHKGEMVQMNLSFDHKPWPVHIERVMAKQKDKGPALMWLSDAITKLLDD